jgi:hypothetical protein
MVCLQAYQRIRTPVDDGVFGSILEFAVVADTSLMMDTWMTGELESPNQAHSFYALLNLLDRRPDLTLRGIRNSQIAEFQNELLTEAGCSVPSVADLCRLALDFLPTLMREVVERSAVHPGIVEAYGNCIRSLLRVRLELLDGACPIGFLALEPRESLDVVVGAVPYVATAISLPVTEGDSDTSDTYPVFAYQAAAHIGPVLGELVFDGMPCSILDRCVLPRRAACVSVTHKLEPQASRCPREAVIAHCLSSWHIDELDLVRR